MDKNLPHSEGPAPDLAQALIEHGGCADRTPELIGELVGDELVVDRAPQAPDGAFLLGLRALFEATEGMQRLGARAGRQDVRAVAPKGSAVTLPAFRDHLSGYVRDTRMPRMLGEGQCDRVVEPGPAVRDDEAQRLALTASSLQVRDECGPGPGPSPLHQPEGQEPFDAIHVGTGGTKQNLTVPFPARAAF